MIEATYMYAGEDIHAAQCMVWMADNGYDNILQTKKKKKNTAGCGDVEKHTSTVKGYSWLEGT